MTTSATGGYLIQSQDSLPGNLTLEQYIQQIFVGMTGLSGTMVRPKWQKNAPTMEATPEDNFMTFGVTEVRPDANSYQETKEIEGEPGSVTRMQRHEELNILCSFYGVNARTNAALLRDGFEISQNRDALRAGKMGLKEVSPIFNIPELKGQVWFQRADMNIVLRRQVDKTFSVLALVGAAGTIEGQKSNDEIENVPWNVSEPT